MLLKHVKGGTNGHSHLTVAGHQDSAVWALTNATDLVATAAQARSTHTQCL